MTKLLKYKQQVKKKYLLRTLRTNRASGAVSEETHSCF